MSRRRAPLVLLVVGTVGLVAGCSDDSDSSSPPAATSPVVTSPDVVATSDPPVDPTTDSDAEPPDELFTGDADSAWCGVARDLEQADTGFDEVDFTDPAAVEAAITTMREQLLVASAEAPPEIADDVQTVVETFAALDDELAAVDYDFLEADLSVLDPTSGDSRSASDRVASYNDQVCGIAPAADDGSTVAGSDFDPSAGTIRDQSVNQLVALGFTQEEAACLFDGLDFTDPELATKFDEIVGAFDSCGIDPARLADMGVG